MTKRRLAGQIAVLWLGIAAAVAVAALTLLRAHRPAAANSAVSFFDTREAGRAADYAPLLLRVGAVSLVTGALIPSLRERRHTQTAQKAKRPRR